MLMWSLMCAWAGTVQVSEPTRRIVESSEATVQVVHRQGGDLWVGALAEPRSLAIWGPSIDVAVLLHRGLKVAGTVDVDQDGDEELLATIGTSLHAFDPATGDSLMQVSLPDLADADGVLVAPVTPQGMPGVVLTHRVGPWRYRVVSVRGDVLWEVVTSSEQQVTTAQLDTDPQHEVVINDTIYDGFTGAIDGTITGLRSQIGVVHTAQGDANHDGVTDLLIRDQLRWVLWDGATRAEAWSYRGDIHNNDDTKGAFVDANQDGFDDVVVRDDTRQMRVLDGRTGVPLPIFFSGDADCDAIAAGEPVPGEPRIFCSNSIFGGDMYDASGTLLASDTHTGHSGAAAFDLDRDGTDELVFWGQQVRLYDQDARLLDTLFQHNSEDTVTFGDGDIDGQRELVDTRQGLVGWSWNPMGGFRRSYTLFPSSNALDNPHVGDVDQNGYLDVLHQTLAGGINRIDLGTGGTTSIVRGPSRDWRLSDLDGDGESEVVALVGDDVVVIRLDGSEIGRVVGRSFDVVPGSGGERLLVYDGAFLVLYTYRGAQLVERYRLDRPRITSAIYWEAGRLWYGVADGMEAWRPTTDERWHFATSLDLVHRPAVTGGHVWLGQGTVIEKWPL